MHIETPLIDSTALADRRVWLKMEALQPTGSFKIRGIGHACAAYAQKGAQRFISSSGGNAGIAVAYAGRCLSIPVAVVVPETTTDRARKLIEREGAELIVHGPSWQEANALALSMLHETDAFIHPFDDPLLWSGHASMIDEVAADGLKPDAVVVSVGGGGLLCGVVEGMQRNDWMDVPIIAVETDGADSLAQSMQSGLLVELPAITSIATSLGARQVCRRALDVAGEFPLISVVVTDQAALTASLRFLDDHRVLVEPACGAALSVVYDRKTEIEPFETLLIIVCGGVTATVDQLQRWVASD